MDQCRTRPEDMRHRVDTRPQGRVHQMRITLGRLHLRMTQQLADHFQGCTPTDQQRREGVAQIMDAHIRLFPGDVPGQPVKEIRRF